MTQPLQLPKWMWVPFVAGLCVVTLPLLGMIARIPWARFGELVTSPQAVQALSVSLVTCAVSTLVAVVIGVPIAVVLASGTSRWRQLMRSLVLMPMVLPPVVAGLALLVTFGRQGLFGRALTLAGINISFSTIAVVVAQTFVSMPYLIVAVEAALTTLGTSYQRVGANLGASPSKVFFRVTLPLAAPALAAGTSLTFARALGEFGATLTFAGSLPGVTRTLPSQIYLVREAQPELALALSLVLIVAALALVWASSLVKRHYD